MDLNSLHDAARREGRVTRRLFLAYGAAISSLPMLAGRSLGASSRVRSFAEDPFTLGVASGDPDSSGFVIWTRLAPKPLEPGGGLAPEAIEVSWEIADDESMGHVVRKGTALATPQLAHSVHVEAEGLEPDRWYWYRFRAGDAQSPIGRARTMPAASASPDSLRFAFASCQNYEQGLFTAFEHMAKDDLDLVVHLGDYIYEGKGNDGRVRKHQGDEIQTLDDYRIRHAQYRSDRLLQAAHARCPWLVTWDDHEVDNNYANDINEKTGVDPIDFLMRRANGYQAYYEMMPLRKGSLPQGPNMTLYRGCSFGRLAEFLVLDTRQYRTDQPNGDKASLLNDESEDSRSTMLGAEQRDWLKGRLIGSEARWNVLAQQVMMGMVGRVRGDERLFSMDQWPGYTYERKHLVEYMAQRNVPNPVVLTGDIHSNWVNDLRVDDRKPETPVVATEFVGTSISSGGNGLAQPRYLADLLAANPGVRFHNTERGYVRCTVTPGSWKSDYVAIEDVTKPGAPAVTRASFVVESGKPGAHLA